MTAKYKLDKISPYQLFSILFVSRIVVSLTYIQNVSVGRLSTDLLISIFLGLLGAFVLSIPLCLCIKKNKNPFDIKWVALLYGLFFIFNSAISITRFSYFATSRFNVALPMFFYILLVAAAACYAACLGIEPLGRFGILCSASLLFVMAVVIVFNIKNVDLINLYPIVDNTRQNVFENAAMLATNTVEPAIMAALHKRVNGNSIKPMALSIAAAFVIIFLIIFMCIGVMGSAAALQAYPIFTLFQMASIGSLSRLDMLHTAFWMMALFLKTAVFIYASSLCVEKFSHNSKTVASSLLTIGAAVVIVLAIGIRNVSFLKVLSLCLSILFLAVIPLLSLLKKKKENLIEGV